MIDWDSHAKNYDKQVYSITKWKSKRDKILKELKDNSNILILGCGSETYLQQDIIKHFPNCKITLSDYFSEMINISKNKFNHPSLSFIKEDMLKLEYNKDFDFIISTNSILMPTIKENDLVFNHCYKALKEDGTFIAYLPSYDSCKRSESLNPAIRDLFCMFDEEQRIGDTIDGTEQSFHTKESIEKNMKSFNNYRINVVSCSETEEEFLHFKDLYGDVLSDDIIKEVFEYLVIAKKGS